MPFHPEYYDWIDQLNVNEGTSSSSSETRLEEEFEPQNEQNAQ